MQHLTNVRGEVVVQVYKCSVVRVISVSISRAVAATAAGPSVHVAAVSGG